MNLKRIQHSSLFVIVCDLKGEKDGSSNSTDKPCNIRTATESLNKLQVESRQIAGLLSLLWHSNKANKYQC